jgi:DNA-binding transcriptional MerR regulator
MDGRVDESRNGADGAGAAWLTIGALAAWAGTTPRAVRHYHRTGVLPEPARTPGGYRCYGLPDLARLLRVRRLVALGLPLARVAEVLADVDAPGRLRDVLQALDADLERQELQVRARRRSIRVLLDGDGGDAAAQVDRLRADLVAALGGAPAVERELDVLEVMAHEAPEAVPEVVAAYRRILDDGAARQLSSDTTELFDRLGAADRAGEPVAELEDAVARGLADLLRHAIGDVAADEPGHPSPPDASPLTVVERLAVGGLTPAQQRAVEHARHLVTTEATTSAAPGQGAGHEGVAP